MPEFKMVNRLKDKRGFTLVELLIVVTIIILLAGLVGQNLFKKLGKGKQASAKAQIEMLGQALDQYRLDMGSYPSTQDGLESLIASTGKEGWDGPYLKKSIVPKDPWGKPYQFVSPGTRAEYDLFTYGKDGAQGGEGEDKDINSWE